MLKTIYVVCDTNIREYFYVASDIWYFNKVMRINDGCSRTDMIQDLVELAALGEKNSAPLTKINFDAARHQGVRTLSHNLSVLLAQANGSSDESSLTKMLCDKAYTLLAERASSVREYGRYVFWKNDDRRNRYYSNYKG